MRILTYLPSIRGLWIVALMLWLLPRAGTAQCLATRTINETETVSVTTTGAATAPYSTLYILTTTTGVVVESNTTGSFTINAASDYQIYTLNYNTTDVPTNVPPTAGSNISAITGGCYNTADFTTEYLCVTVNPFACLASTTINQGDALLVGTTGNTSTAEFATYFVLVDAVSGLVVTSNTTGVFTNDVTCGNSYIILTLNYNVLDAPNPLPLNAGDQVSSIGSVTAGCYNRPLAKINNNG
jgi:hypothetical protein